MRYVPPQPLDTKVLADRELVVDLANSVSLPRIALGLRISTSICVIADTVRLQNDDARTNRRLIPADSEGIWNLYRIRLSLVQSAAYCLPTDVWKNHRGYIGRGIVRSELPRAAVSFRLYALEIEPERRHCFP